MKELLAGLRVLDVTTRRGAYAGKLFADMGAQVIKIEPPQGSDERRQGPFLNRDNSPDSSLAWHWYNANKLGITLNLESGDGQHVFRQLVAKSHVVLESFTPGYMASLGLSHEQLESVNPSLVFTSITPYGQTGEKAKWATTEMTVFADSGLAYVSGNSDGPPVLAPGEQTYIVAGAHAAFATLVALWEARRRGRGQAIDVSMQECLAAQENLVTDYTGPKKIVRRMGSQHIRAVPGRVYPCKDGYVHIMVVATQLNSWQRFLEWIGNPPELADEVWADNDYRLENIEYVDEITRRFTMQHTKQELYETGQAYKIPIAPVNTLANFVHDPQALARDFVQEVEHVHLGRMSFPWGAPKFSETPLILKQPGPTLGQHNTLIYEGLLGYTSKDIQIWRAAGVI